MDQGRIVEQLPISVGAKLASGHACAGRRRGTSPRARTWRWRNDRLSSPPARTWHSAAVRVLPVAVHFAEAAPGDFLSDMRLNSQISDQTLGHASCSIWSRSAIPVRYLHWMKSTLHGDFGFSFAYNVPVSGLSGRVPTHRLIDWSGSGLISLADLFPVGVLAAANRKPWVDRLFATGTSLFLSVPDILLALLALLIALNTRLFPTGGMTSGGLNRPQLPRTGRCCLAHAPSRHRTRDRFTCPHSPPGTLQRH